MSRDLLRPWKPGRGQWDAAAAAHLLRRGGFGGSSEDVERALDDGLEATLAGLFDRDAHDPRLERGIESLLPAGDVDALAAWWMALILEDGAPLRERVALMWHDHFATSNAKVDDVRLMYRQNRLFRERGLGDFRELLHAVATDPAMLVWLDGNANRRGRPNENFAREVMELFALGIGNYTEHDVREIARAFTGWGTKGRAFVVLEERHDPGVKEIFGLRGPYDGADAVDRILAHPACPRHVARRLLAELVAPDPPEEWVAATAAFLLDHGWSVRETIEVLLASELFFSPAARRTRIAAPVELVASSAHALGARVAPRTATAAATDMGQVLFRPPSVKGWDGMRAWIDAGTWVARHNALVALAQAHLGGEGGMSVDLRAAFGGTSAAAIVGALVPDLTQGPFAERIAAAMEAEDDADRALSLGTALVLTSPEYQLF